MKKLVSLLLALLLVAAIPAFAEGTSEAVTDEKVTLTALAMVPSNVLYTEDLASNWFTQYLEEKTNVHIDWTTVTYGADSADNSAKFNTILASGDYPDLFLSNPFTKITLYQAGLDGVVIPLNDLIEQNAPNLKQIFADLPETVGQITAPDGNIYGIGFYTGYYHGEAPRRYWIYQPWLDALNLEMPQTTDELLDVLEAFRDNDCNGNGDATDEIPMLNLDPTYLLCPFVYYDGSNLEVEDGQIKFVADTDAYRDGLRFMKTIYDEKLVPQDVFTLDNTQCKALVMDDEYRVGTMAAFSFGGFFTDASKAESKAFNLAPLTPVAGPDGTRQTPLNVFTMGINRFSVTSKCEHPDVAVRWMDWLMDISHSNTSHYGPVYETPTMDQPGWWHAAEGQTNCIGEQAVWGCTQLTTDAANYNNNLSWGMQVGPWYMPTEFHDSMVVSGTSKGETWYYQASLDYDPYKTDKSIPSFFMSEEGSSAISEYKAMINPIVDQYRAEFITGVKDLDTDWEAYLAELDGMDLTGYLEIYQKEYDAIFGNK